MNDHGTRIRRKRSTTLLSAAFVALVALCASLLPGGLTGTAAAAELTPRTTQPFSTNNAFGYACFRIPQLVRTKQALIAFAEGRVKDCNDVGNIDIVARRSTDDGKTWESGLQVIRGAGDPHGYGNPAPVVTDFDRGHITLLYAFNEVKGTARQDRELQRTESTDGGASWTSTKEVLTHLKEPDWEWISVGPGKGVRLASGRLVVSGEYRRGTDENPPVYGGAVFYYSDDNGKTWAMGARSEALETPEGTHYPSEPSTALLPDGRVYVNARSKRVCGTRDRRLSAEIGAADIANTKFRVSFSLVGKMEAPPVSGSLLRGASGKLLFSSPVRHGAESNDRFTLAIRSSSDQGKTWSTSGAVIHRARAGYSDMEHLLTGEIGVLYEHAGGSPHGNITFAAFKEADLTGAQEDLRAKHTGDSSGAGNNAVVQGAAQFGTGYDGVGKSLRFDGKDDAVRVPCSDSLRLGTSDFTVSTWVKYGPDTSTPTEADPTYDQRPRPVIVGYGQDSSSSELKIVANRDGSISGSIRGKVAVTEYNLDGEYLRTWTGESSLHVHSATGLDNNAWHHVALRRKGDLLELAVDGRIVSGVGDPTGQAIDLRITKPKDPENPDRDKGPFSIRFGADHTYIKPFAGEMDEVRIHGAFLTPAELTSLMAGTEVQEDKKRLALPFNSVWTF
ncbi:exo-alpha-sialidase [Streptomyces sp. NPDC059874]|uniref:exo-alpha-sialidase n=1 Tax=Streptomyces sp. NPDC059874 TaxID=3346983 RepID=UPI00365DA4D6